LVHSLALIRSKLKETFPMATIPINDLLTELLLATCFFLVSYRAYSSTLKMHVTCSYRTSSEFKWTTSHYISEDITLH
jgi:hypothetical protein